MVRCAILIVHWNSWEHLHHCLESLAKQSYKDFRVFVADNASKQPPPDGIFSTLPDIFFVKNELNYGFAKANNLLLEHAKEYELTVFLNPDSFPEPDWFEQLISAVKENPGYSFFASRLLVAKHPDILDGDGDNFHITGYAWRFGHGKPVDNSRICREVFSPCAASAMYRTKAIIDVGGFDEDFFCYLEDVDLGFRLRLIGNKCLLVPSARVRHVGSATSSERNPTFQLYHGHRNLVWTYVKNMPGLLFWTLMPFHLSLNLFSIVWFVLRGNGCAILNAKCDAIKGIPSMWRKRRDIQAARVVSAKEIWRIMNKQFLPWISSTHFVSRNDK
jgi:GT2 family glycosyltransferase